MKILLDHHPLAPSNAAPTNFGAMVRTRPAWISTRQPQPLSAQIDTGGDSRA